MIIKLKDIAHGRSGDKSDTENVCIFARDPKYYDAMKRQLTPEAVKEHYKGIVKGDVIRYDIPQLYGFNFVLHHALDGGATRSLRLDTLGKCMEAALLRFEIDLDK
ncbi:AtuA-related protein [Clostridium sp. LBM24168]